MERWADEKGGWQFASTNLWQLRQSLPGGEHKFHLQISLSGWHYNLWRMMNSFPKIQKHLWLFVPETLLKLLLEGNHSSHMFWDGLKLEALHFRQNILKCLCITPSVQNVLFLVGFSPPYWVEGCISIFMALIRSLTDFKGPMYSIYWDLLKWEWNWKYIWMNF